MKIEVGGNLQSLRKTIIAQLEELYDIQLDKDEFVSGELIAKMAYLTDTTNREISVYLDRKGSVSDVRVGDDKTVSLSEPEGKRNANRLSGIRCIHTHPGGNSMLSEIDINTLYALRLDAMAAIGVREGKATGISVVLPFLEKTYGSETNNGSLQNDKKVEFYGPYTSVEATHQLMSLIAEKDRLSANPMEENEQFMDRAVLVGIELPDCRIIGGKSESEVSMEELEELTWTAGGQILEKIIQKRSARDSAFLLGRGKMEEINLICQAKGANTLIFDSELTGAQMKNIEAVTGLKVLDRTNLILDIFAQRARSREGKLQVELAQLRYVLPRLMGLGNQLSRLGGGIGTRGPGEKKLETDRRHIRRRIDLLEEQLEKVKKQRETTRKSRERNNIPVFALVGYTNAGKSTLLNKLCQSDVFAEDKLFATLDPTTRKFELQQNMEALMTDTVGFIRNLPHHLVEAFKSTLEEAVFADVLLHVVDKAAEQAQDHIAVVEKILSELGTNEKTTILVLNKADKKEAISNPIQTADYPYVYEISAITGEGIDRLSEGMAAVVKNNEVTVDMLVPYSEGWVEAFLHQNGQIISTEYREDGARIQAQLKNEAVSRIQRFIQEDSKAVSEGDIFE